MDKNQILTKGWKSILSMEDNIIWLPLIIHTSVHPWHCVNINPGVSDMLAPVTSYPYPGGLFNYPGTPQLGAQIKPITSLVGDLRI